MYHLFFRLMVLVALSELGITLMNVRHVEKASRDVLRVEWKPISVWPEEGNRFR